MTAPAGPSFDAVNNFHPIPTPWPVRWRRFRYRTVPFITMALCVLATLWLWRRHAGSGNAVGAVETYKATISSDAQGVLAPSGERELQLFDAVKKGDVVARIDAKHLRAELDRLQREISNAQDAAPAGATPTTAAPTTGPGRGAAEALEAVAIGKMQEIDALERRLEASDIRAPFDGVVTEVQRRPGETVHVGQQIMEIAAEAGTHVVSYLRQEQRIEPVAGMTVEIRRLTGAREVVQGTVEAVGVQFQSVPTHQLADKRTPEWGLPVRIAMPAGANLRPGEMVTITFPRGGTARAGAS